MSERGRWISASPVILSNAIVRRNQAEGDRGLRTMPGGRIGLRARQ